MHSEAWTKNEIDLLGTNTDQAIAELIGRTPTAIQHKRKEMGISSFYRFAWTLKHIRQLGKKPDGVLAQSWGLKRLAVIRKRQKLGIAPFKKPN